MSNFGLRDSKLYFTATDIVKALGKSFPQRFGGRWHRCSILNFKMNSISRVEIKAFAVFIGGDG
jgi:hypothetical protein